MSEFTAELKARADIGAVIGESVALKKTANGWLGLCPFHGEKTPSFHVHAARQFFYCFGCQAHGDVYAFLMQGQKIGFREAVELLAAKLGVSLPGGWGEGEGEDDGRRAALREVHTAAARFFAAQLHAPQGAGARAYLEGRGVGPAAIARFGIGFAPGSGRALTEWLRRQGFASELALAAGLCQPRRATADAATGTVVNGWDDLYDRFRDRVAFPIADERGRVIAFGGRQLGTPDPQRPAPKYINSPETPIYTKGRVVYNLDRAREAIRRLGYYVLVEGYLDCVAVFMAGFENVVASCGTALTAAQIGALSRHAKSALVNFDPDAAGAAAAEKSIALLLEDDYKVRVARLPGGLDPDAFLRSNGRDAYAEALKTSAPFFDFLAERARGRFDLRRAEGRVEALNFLLPYVVRVQDAMLRAELADELANQLGIENAVERQRLRQASGARRARIETAETPGSDLLPAEAVILRALFEWEQERESLLAQIAEGELLAGLATSAIVARCAAEAGRGGFDLAGISAQLEAGDRRLLAEVLMVAGEPIDARLVAGALAALRERQLERRRRQLRSQVKEAQEAGERGRLEALLGELRALDAKLAGAAPSGTP